MSSIIVSPFEIKFADIFGTGEDATRLNDSTKVDLLLKITNDDLLKKALDIVIEEYPGSKNGILQAAQAKLNELAGNKRRKIGQLNQIILALAEVEG